jgi:hypothetical protein
MTSPALKTRRGYAARGLCWQCGKEPTRPGKILGEKCAIKYRMRNLAPAKKCRDCPTTIRRGSNAVRCEKCALVRDRKRADDFHERQRESGQCRRCGEPKSEITVYCERCLKFFVDRRHDDGQNAVFRSDGVWREVVRAQRKDGRRGGVRWRLTLSCEHSLTKRHKSVRICCTECEA